MPMSPNRKFITESCKDIEKLYELISSFCATSGNQRLVMYRRIGSSYKYRRILTAEKNNTKLELTPSPEQFRIVYTDYIEHAEKRISKYKKS